MTEIQSAFDPRAREGYRAWTTIPVRFGDQDVMGHVNNVAIASYFEHARCEQLVPSMRPLRPRLSTVLARITIDYLREIHFPGAVDVGIRITASGTKSFVIAGAVFRAETCCATSEATMVFFDPEARRSAVPSPATWAALQFLR